MSDGTKTQMQDPNTPTYWQLKATVEEQAAEIKRLNGNLLTVRSERDIYKAEAESVRDSIDQMETDDE